MVDDIERFKQEVVKIALQVHERLRKYGVDVVVNFYPVDNPEYYHLYVELPRSSHLDEGLFREFVSELEAIGFVYVPGADNWGILGKIGQYPPLKL